MRFGRKGAVPLHVAGIPGLHPSVMFLTAQTAQLSDCEVCLEPATGQKLLINEKLR